MQSSIKWKNWRKTYRPNKKNQTTENIDTKDDIWDNTIPLTEPNNSPMKWYPTRNWKPVIRYGLKTSKKVKGCMLYTLTYNST